MRNEKLFYKKHGCDPGRRIKILAAYDHSGIRFQGQAGDTDFMDVQAQGSHNFARLNALLGYAFL